MAGWPGGPRRQHINIPPMPKIGALYQGTAELTAYRENIRAYNNVAQGITYTTASPTPTSVSGQGNTPVSYTKIALSYRLAKIL